MKFLSLLLTALVLCQCGSPQPPVCRILPVSSRVPATDAMATARTNWIILSDSRRKADWPTALAAYNNSVRVLFDQMRCGTTIFPRCATDWNHDRTSVRSQRKRTAADAVFPATAVKIRTKDRHHLDPDWVFPRCMDGDLPSGRSHGPSSATQRPTRKRHHHSRFFRKTPTWRFPKRWTQNDFDVGGMTHHLAADWTAPIDFFWYMCDLDDLRIQNVLSPTVSREETGLYFLQPYDPEKIPVVMVHGLVSSPDAYRDILNDLSPEPWFREKYQVWLYNYPTGTPWLYNAMRFRQIMGQASNFARTMGDDTNLKKMVILSHSMGGLLTRTAVSDPGNALYDAYFNTPFDQLDIKPETRTLIREGLLYDPLTDPKRVVFMAVPHRGSPMANFRGTAFYRI